MITSFNPWKKLNILLYGQCDQMAKLFFQHLAIYNNENLRFDYFL